MSNAEKAYWTHEMSEILGVSDSTIRKWCLELEKNGYTFAKGANDSRAFTSHDMLALKLFKDLLKVNKLTKEQASVIVCEQYKTKEGNEVTTPMQADKALSETQALAVLINELKERLDEQDKKIQDQEKFIEERLNKRDEMLMNTIREMAETRKQLAVIEEQRKKKPWWKFF